MSQKAQQQGLSEEEKLRAYLNAAKRQQNASAAAGGGGLTSPTADDDDFRDLETFESLSDMDHLITSVLNKDVNLKDLLGQQDDELDEYMDQFINAHCDEAENLCNLYHQVTECEGKLNDFESQIRDFLDRLTETADEVVQMQRSTDDLHIRVQNRKSVKSEITLVYEAIMECGKFCDDIVRRDVDASFLHEMRAYDAKLSKWNSLLESNPNLVGSAVDLEISPRLASAAQRVGDKLQRYMQSRFDQLQDVGINLVLHQQIMEATGQYAFRFLASYNKPVAEKLKASYLYIISEVHTRAIRNALQDLLDAGTFASLPYEAVLPDHVLKLMASSYDVTAQRDFFMNITKAFGGQQSLSRGDGTVAYEAAACGLPPLASPKSCRFYLREDEYLSEFVATNDLSSIPSPSTALPRRANSVMPPIASPSGGVGARRAGSVAGGSSSSSGFGGLNINSMKSMINKLGGQSSVAKELATPFANAKDLRAATFENQVHALRAIHILEAAVVAAANNGGGATGQEAGPTASSAPVLGVSPERKNHTLSVTPPTGTTAAPTLGSSAPQGGAVAGASTAGNAAASSTAVASGAAVPPNYMGTIILDPIVVNRLAKTDCWAIRAITLLTNVVNAITSERKFVRNFLLSHIRDTLRGDLEEEVILRSIFFQILQQVESSLVTEIAALTDPITMLVMLRSVELLKNFVFQCPSPNPIMLLSSLFGSVSAALREGLYTFLSNDEKSIQKGVNALRNTLPPLDQSKFPSIANAPTFNGEVDVIAMIQQDAAFASTLTVHPTVVSIAQLTAKLHALNVLHLKGSYVDVGSDATTFDDTVESTLRSIMGGCYTFINQLSHRFDGLKSRTPSLVFVIVNLGHILYRWLSAARSARGLPSSMPLLVSHSSRRPTASNNSTASVSQLNPNDASPTALLLKAQLLFDDEDQQREAKNTDVKVPAANGSANGGRSTSPARRGVSMAATSGNALTASSTSQQRTTSPSRSRFVATQSLSLLDQSLTDAIHAFVLADISARFGAIRAAMDVVDKIESTLGPNGLLGVGNSSPTEPVASASPELAAPDAAASPQPLATSSTASPSTACPVDVDTFAQVTAAFSNGWQDQLERIRNSLKILFTTTVMLMINGPTSSSPASPSGGKSANGGLLLDADQLLKAAENAVASTGAQPMSAALPHVNAAVLTRAAEANELLKRVLHDYFRVVVDTNTRLVIAARKYFGDNGAIQSKLIGHHALEHELQQLLTAR